MPDDNEAGGRGAVGEGRGVGRGSGGWAECVLFLNPQVEMGLLLPHLLPGQKLTPLRAVCCVAAALSSLQCRCKSAGSSASLQECGKMQGVITVALLVSMAIGGEPVATSRKSGQNRVVTVTAGDKTDILNSSDTQPATWHQDPIRGLRKA